MISRIKRILESHLCNLYILHIENGTTVLFSPNRPNPSSRWWYKGMAKYHQNDECFVRICPLMNDAPRSVVVLKKGPSLDYLQWKNSSSLIYRARKHIYDSVDLSKCSLDDHLRRKKKSIFRHTFCGELYYLLYYMRYKCSFSKGSKDKFETFYAIFNLIDRIQCKWSKVCSAQEAGG